MADKTIAIKVDVQGTTEQNKKLAQLETEVKKLTIQRQKLNKAVKDGTISLDQYGKELAEINTKLKANRREMLVARENILGLDSFTKKLGKSFNKLGTSIGGAFVGLFALQKLGGIISGALDTIIEFEQQMANVKAITGATEEEFEALEKSAKELGRTTRRTALEVANLQEEYAKLGFTTEEILAATEATVKLSEATGSDLAQSANVAASTLNGFRLEADETQRIVDVMAASFTSSALDLGKFEVAMRQVAPVAAEAGMTIEETTAFLGVLADNGIRAETAGTGLRNIFLTLAKTGLSLDEAMEAINTSTNKAATATELFGKENAVVATTIANNTEAIDSQAEAFLNAAGAAEEMAEITGDTLSGDLDRLSSAWDGFVLSVDEGEGVIGGALRGIVSFATDLLSTVEEINDLEFAKSTGDKTVRSARAIELEEIKRIAVASKELTSNEEEAEKLRIANLKSREEVLKRVVENEEKLLTDLEIKLDKVEELTESQKIELVDQETYLKLAQKRLEFLIDFNKKEEEKRTGLAEETGLQKLLNNIREASEEKLNELAKIGVAEAQKELDRREAVEKIRKKAAKDSAKDLKNKAREEKKLADQRKKDLEDSIDNTKKLEQEALILSIDNKQEAEDKKLEIARQNAIEEVKVTENKEKEIKAINDKFDAEKKVLEDERKKETEEETKTFEKEVLSQKIAIAEQTANALIEVANRKSEREKDIELSNLDAKLQQGLISQADFEKEREAIERKAFNKQKRLELAQIAISLAREIASINANAAANPANAVTFGAAGLSQASVLTGLAVARSAVQAGVIASQSFAEGGFTGDGFGSADATGFKQAGVVHEGEYVVPKNVLESQKGGQLVGALEAMRTSRPQPNIGIGFANGGFASAPSGIDMNELENRISNAVANSINTIQVVNNATDTVNQAVRVNNIITESTFG